MDIIHIPFAKHVGIEEKETNHLMLSPKDEIANHMHTMHAGALFTLSESQSGVYLEQCFPQWRGKVMALLRSSDVKYKRPATSDVYAHASIEKVSKEKFIKQLDKKRRTTIIIMVVIKDIDNTIIMDGTFCWYVEKL